MPEIIPRWEWRTFGRRFGLAEAAFGALEATGIQESDELYLLSTAGDNVKVRDGLMDIKRLEEVDADDLERWTPIMKAGFPLGAAETADVLAALGIEVPRLARETYTLAEFVAELVDPSGSVRPVDVHKRRVRYVVGGCTSEVSDVTAAGRTTRTIAIESEDKAAVLAAVRAVGLDGFVNTSYPKGLAALVDGVAERYAVIDCGTNSVKLHVAERQPDGGWSAVADRAEITRLGEGLEQAGEIGPDALDRTAGAIAAMAGEARRLGVGAIVAVGTAGLRIARNADAVVDAIAGRTGIRIVVISGEDESRIAYLAATHGPGITDGGTRVVFDTGGGSTQFTFGSGDRIDERFSVDVGAVRLTERFGLGGVVTEAVVAQAGAAIAADLGRIAGRPRPDLLVAMGGAVTSLAAVRHSLATYHPDVVQGTVLDRAEIERQIELYRRRDVAGRRQIVGLQPKRADVILAGALVVRTVLELLGRDSLVVSDRGLRHGVLVTWFG